MNTGALVIFILAYTGIVAFKRYKELILWMAIAVAMVFGLVKADYFFDGGVNWNIIGVFIGSLIIAELFIVSRIPESVADILINRSPNVSFAFLFIIAFASFLSSFIENVATVLIVAPIAVELARRAEVSPVPALIGLAVSSNLQGTATLIGDPPSMILAAAMKMNFTDFFYYQGRMGIFFFVQLGAILGFIVLFLFFRGQNRKVGRVQVTEVRSWVPMVLLVVMVGLLSAASIVDKEARWFAGASCVAAASVGIVWLRMKDRAESINIARRFDYRTLAFLIGIFVIVSMLERNNVIAALVTHLEGYSGVNNFVLLSVVVWLSVLLSAFIDNIPYITAMIPIVKGMAPDGSELQIMLIFGLLIGSCLGGNITPIGASANIVATGFLKREGWDVSFWNFVRIGLPFTVAATLGAQILLYLVYAVW